MRRSLTILTAAACAAVAAGQASFECAPVGPLPGDPAANCGKASRPTARCPSTGVSATASCGFPTQGLQYLLRDRGRVGAESTGGRPHPETDRGGGVRGQDPDSRRHDIQVSFDWEFFNSEGSPSASFNDGMSIDVVGPTGNFVGGLVYADANTPAGSCTHARAEPSARPRRRRRTCSPPSRRTRPATTSRSSSGTAARTGCESRLRRQRPL